VEQSEHRISFDHLQPRGGFARLEYEQTFERTRQIARNGLCDPPEDVSACPCQRLADDASDPEFSR
jgi:hypothetical protein